MSSVIQIDRRGDIAVLTFNRPHALNALTQEMAAGIADTLVALDSDASVKGIVLTGAGDRAFCAGLDLEEARATRVEDVERTFGTVCNLSLIHISEPTRPY